MDVCECEDGVGGVGQGVAIEEPLIGGARRAAGNDGECDVAANDCHLIMRRDGNDGGGVHWDDVLIKRQRVVVMIGEDEVGFAVAVQIASGDADGIPAGREVGSWAKGIGGDVAWRCEVLEK